MESMIKKRSLNLAQPLTSLQEKALMERFSGLAGVRQFEVNGSLGVRITYDLMTVNLKSIAELLSEMNHRLSNGPFQRFKHGWISFVEENELENMKIVPHSCCQDPKNR